jgi:four helix bundle protein
MTVGVSSCRDLTVWKTSMELARGIYALTRDFPAREACGLTSQVQRAAVSIPANIAEGHARSSTKEFLHHLSIARGSLAELETLLLLAVQLDYCGPTGTKEIRQQCDEVSRMLSGLRKRLKERIDGNH